MRARRSMKLTLAALTVSAVAASPASAAVPHTVQPGETLWSIAAANNLHTNALATFNGVSPDSNVIVGSTINVPTDDEALVAVNSVPQQAATPEQTDTAFEAPASGTSGGPPALGGYTVKPGETLSGI